MCIAQRLLTLSCLSRVAWAPAAVKGLLHGWSSGGTETGRDAVTGAGPLGPVPLPDPLALPPAHRKPLGSCHHRLPPRLHLLELHQLRSLLRAQPHDLL